MAVSRGVGQVNGPMGRERVPAHYRPPPSSPGFKYHLPVDKIFTIGTVEYFVEGEVVFKALFSYDQRVLAQPSAAIVLYSFVQVFLLGMGITVFVLFCARSPHFQPSFSALCAVDLWAFLLISLLIIGVGEQGMNLLKTVALPRPSRAQSEQKINLIFIGFIGSWAGKTEADMH